VSLNFPNSFDAGYFSFQDWKDRLQSWLGTMTSEFASANAKSIERMLADPKTSVRVVINIRPDAIITFLHEGRYRNIYQLPEIGAKGPDQNRLDADAKVGTGPGHYFGAAAMGGVGIRYYGEYCVVLKADFADGNTQVFDRDSYDVLFPPLDQLSNHHIDCLKGSWDADIASMIMLRVMPELNHQRQIVTSGTVIELVLKDQEFIEVHLTKDIRPDDVDQVVESPETAAMEARILERQRNALPNRMHELEWVRRRAEVVRRLELHGIRHRVVTQHGRGFQWR
jgi:hypothetical protein